MAFEHKEGSGALFKNDKKGNDRAPDYRGDIKVKGEVMEIAAWLKDGNNGKFMSLSVKPKQSRQKPDTQDHGTPRQQATQAVRDMDEDLPFDNPYKGRKSYVE